MGEMEVNAGYAGGIGIAKEVTANTAVTPPTKWLEIESETLDNVVNFIDTPGIDGTRSKSKHRSAKTTEDPRGGFKINGLKGADLDLLLELALGNYGSGTGYVADALPTFTAVKKILPEYHVFSGCKVASMEFESSDENQALQCAIELIAMRKVAGTSGSFGTPSYANEVPLIHLGSTFRVHNTEIKVKSFKARIANTLDDKIYRSSATRLALPETGEREVNGELTLDWNQANLNAVMARYRAGSYAQLRADYTNGVYRISFVFPNCRFPSTEGQIGNKDSIGLPVKFEARSSGPAQRDEVYIYRAAV